MNHVCEYCGSEFKIKTKWYEHEIVCKLIHKIDKSETISDELITTNTIYKALIQVIKKQNKMEKDVNELKRQIIIKINIIDWINKNLKPTTSINHFITKISTKIEPNIELLLEENIDDFLKSFLINKINLYLKENKNTIELPIFTYKNKIYIYNTKTQKWKEETDLCQKIYELWSYELINSLNNWKQINLKNDNDNIERKFNITLLHLIDENKNKTHIKIIRDTILEYIKTEITTVSYQIV